MSKDKEEFPQVAPLPSGSTPSLSRLRDVERTPFTWCESCDKGYTKLGKCDTCGEVLKKIGWWEV